MSDHPMMGSMCRNLSESHAKSKMDMPLIEDTDDMGDFNSVLTMMSKLMQSNARFKMKMWILEE